MSENYPKLAQGQAVPANHTDKVHDRGGITYPNLHRRIDNDSAVMEPGEVLPDEFAVSVAGVSSYRTTKHISHTDDATVTQSFVGDGETTMFKLHNPVGVIVKVAINSQIISEFEFDEATNSVILPEAPAQDDTILITYAFVSNEIP